MVSAVERNRRRSGAAHVPGIAFKASNGGAPMQAVRRNGVSAPLGADLS